MIPREQWNGGMSQCLLDRFRSWLTYLDFLRRNVAWGCRAAGRDSHASNHAADSLYRFKSSLYAVFFRTKPSNISSKYVWNELDRTQCCAMLADNIGAAQLLFVQPRSWIDQTQIDRQARNCVQVLRKPGYSSPLLWKQIHLHACWQRCATLYSQYHNSEWDPSRIVTSPNANLGSQPGKLALGSS